MSTPLFCRDCIYSDLGRTSTPPPGWPTEAPALHWWCRLNAQDNLDIVSGLRWGPRCQGCHDMRKEGAPCGPEAKLFEPRETEAKK